nr:PREDICTED: uncharacterized protein LOC106500013 isoform X1 [Apteryx mantelli mantelli]XP_013817141.1 PREDICTED: uncharacterized protein LOC106500013 isoform X2 [Apteryx mantelli mantelli]
MPAAASLADWLHGRKGPPTRPAWGTVLPSAPSPAWLGSAHRPGQGHHPRTHPARGSWVQPRLLNPPTGSRPQEKGINRRRYRKAVSFNTVLPPKQTVNKPTLSVLESLGTSVTYFISSFPGLPRRHGGESRARVEGAEAEGGASLEGPAKAGLAPWGPGDRSSPGFVLGSSHVSCPAANAITQPGRGTGPPRGAGTASSSTRRCDASSTLLWDSPRSGKAGRARPGPHGEDSTTRATSQGMASHGTSSVVTLPGKSCSSSLSATEEEPSGVQRPPYATAALSCLLFLHPCQSWWPRQGWGGDGTSCQLGQEGQMGRDPGTLQDSKYFAWKLETEGTWDRSWYRSFPLQPRAGGCSHSIPTGQWEGSGAK